MPFGLFHTAVTLLLVLLVLAWHWLPFQAAPFLACSLAAAFSLVPRPGFLSRVLPPMTALFLAAFFFLYGPPALSELLPSLPAGLLLVFWWRRQDVGDYLALFVIAIVDLFLTLLLRRPLTVWHWGMLPPMVMLVVVYAHLVRIRYDMETHTIVKHRLGRQSRRVDVARLLQSRRALDVPVIAVMLAVGALTAALSMGIVHASSPLLGKLHLNLSGNGDFPAQLDLGRMGRPVVDGHAQLSISPVPRLQEDFYWRGQVYDRLEKGVWFRRPFVPASPESGECAQYVARRENPALTDGFAPLGVKWAADIQGHPLPVSDDGRVSVPFGMREYRVCAAPGKPPVSKPQRPKLAVSGWVLRAAQGVVDRTKNFDENLQRVLRFLENYRYSEAYPRVPAGRDPLVHFLFFSRSGPCGLFASAAAVLLDQAGIPVRLVTGFSPGEPAADGLRMTSAHAHSWLEAWHPEHGWVIVDPTRFARLGARRFVAAGSAGAMMLGFTLALLLFGAIAAFWWRKSIRRAAVEKSAPPPPYAGFISQMKLEAQMLFHEWISGPEFGSLPRKTGENARDYADRLEKAGHPRAREVREAAAWASRVLFAPIEDAEKIELLQKLRNLLIAQSKKENNYIRSE